MRKLTNRGKGLLLLLSALVIHAVDQTVARQYIEQSATSQNSTLASYIIVWIFGKMGVNSIIAVIVVLGGFYIVIGDMIASFLSDKIDSWLESILNSLDVGFDNISKAVYRGTANIEKDIVMKWMKEGKCQPSEYREVAINGLNQFYGTNPTDKASYLNYILDSFLDKTLMPGAIYRQNVHTNIMITRCNDSSSPYYKKIMWKENGNFQIVSKAPATKFRFPMNTEVRLPESYIMDYINNAEWEIKKQGKVIFSLKSSIHNCTKEQIMSPEGWKNPEYELTIIYKDGSLEICMNKEIDITDPITAIYYTDNGFLPEDEDTYLLSMMYPSKDFKLDFSASTDFTLHSPSVGPRSYYMGAEDNIHISGPRNNSITIHVSQWVLPGICAAITWR